MTVPIAFTVPLTGEAHQIARQLSSGQLGAKRAKRVYLNSLAVYATDFYLQCMEIESENFFDRDPSVPTIEEYSTLDISGIGKLECCPVLESDRTARLPAETWGDRMGYMVVQFNESLTTANLLGFLQKTTTEVVPFDELESLEAFLVYITHLEESQSANSLQQQKTVKLSQWWYDTVETSWETLDALFPRTQLAWRNCPVPTRHSKHSVTRAKILNLAKHDRVVLALEILPLHNSEIEICLELYPLEPQIHLPENLNLSVLDDKGAEVIKAEARTTENIQIKFVADPGELFGVRVSLEEASVTESFVV